MSAAQHTTGPWSRVDGQDYAEIYAPVEDRVVAMVGKAEDADLVAAAPMLLEALQTAITALEESRKPDPDFPDFDRWEASARIAIAQATGGAA